MNFFQLSPMLAVADIERSMRFYCGVLGFQELGRFEPGGQLVWASLARGPVEIMLHRSEAPQEPSATARVTLYLYCDDVAAVRDAVAQSGRAVTPLMVRFYRMKEFEFDDDDGHHFICAANTDEPPTPEE